MSFTTTLTTWATERQERKADSWRKRQEATANSLPNWRTPARQKLLLKLYFFSLAFGIVVAIGQLFWTPLLLGWLLTTIGICVFWTMLRITIQSKDDAPLEVLDEYEADVINSWRKISHDLLLASSTTFFAVLIFFTVLTFNIDTVLGHDPLWWVYTWALLGIVVSLAIAALPAVGYVMAFAREDEAEDD